MLRSICLVMLCLALPAAHARAEEVAPPEASARDWFENPTRTRGFLGQTALPLHAGEGFIGQQGLAITTAGVGLTERVSVSASTLIPLIGLVSAASSTPDDFWTSLLVNLKVTHPLAERLHVALGAQGVAVMGRDVIGTGNLYGISPYGILTYGTSDAHVSLTLQAVFLEASQSVDPKRAVIPMVSGFVRLGRGWGLATEVMASLPSGVMANRYAVVQGGARLFGPSWSADLGLVAARELEARGRIVPLPALSFMCHWR